MVNILKVYVLFSPIALWTSHWGQHLRRFLEFHLRMWRVIRAGGLRRGVEVCANETLVELHRRRQHSASAVQYDSDTQVTVLRLEVDQWSVSRSRRRRPPAALRQTTDFHQGQPLHHAAAHLICLCSPHFTAGFHPRQPQRNAKVNGIVA